MEHLLATVIILTLANEALNSKEISVLQNDQIDILEELKRCEGRIAEQYQDLSNLTFNPRQVHVQDTACLGYRMFEDLGFVKTFNISEITLFKFILQAQKGYQNNPYHNWLHGFSVLHFTFSIIKNCDLIKKEYITTLEGLAVLTAAMCHDLDHPGTNNQFQLETNSSLAQQYGQQGSILERHHIAETLELTSNMDTNFLTNLGEKNRTRFENLIKQTILATNLAAHQAQLLPEEEKMTVRGIDKSCEQDRSLVRSAIISCADLSDQTRDWETVRRIAKLVYSEFFAQGDQEKKLGITPNKAMDRNQAIIPKNQKDFISFVVIPNFRVLSSICPETHVFIENMTRNMENWVRTAAYFEKESKKGRTQLDILSDTNLDNVQNL